ITMSAPSAMAFLPLYICWKHHGPRLVAVNYSALQCGRPGGPLASWDEAGQRLFLMAFNRVASVTIAAHGTIVRRPWVAGNDASSRGQKTNEDTMDVTRSEPAAATTTATQQAHAQ